MTETVELGFECGQHGLGVSDDPGGHPVVAADLGGVDVDLDDASG